MRTTEATLPNGIITGSNTVTRDVEIRQLSGEEEEILVDKESHIKGFVLDRIMKNCIIRIGNTTERALIEKLYDEKLLVGDLSYLLIYLRTWGIGWKYKFSDDCPTCERHLKPVLDLRTLKITEQKEEYRGKEEFVETIKVDEEPEHVMVFRHMYVRDQNNLQTLKETYPKDKLTHALMLPIKTFDGKPADAKVIKALPMSVRNAMRNAMDDKQGGVDVRIEIKCPRCGIYSKNMPVDHRSFFFQATGSSGNETEATPFLDSGRTLFVLEKPSDGSLQKSVA